MVAKHSPTGLIATTRSDSTRPLDDLADYCGWPLLLDATPRRLHRELSHLDPECVLFWLDDWRGVASTAKLVAWSRERGARPFRVAVAFQLEGDVESVFRAAGAHSFLPVAGQSVAFIADALWPMLQRSACSSRATAYKTIPAIAASDQVTAIEFPADLIRPP